MTPTFLLALCARPILHGYALKRFRRHLDILSRDEIRSIADEGLLEACKRFDPDKGSFVTFARFWVARQIRRAIRHELTWHKQRVGENDTAISYLETLDSEEHFEDEVVLRQLMGQLDAPSRDMWHRHNEAGEPLRELARRYGQSIRQLRNHLSRTDARIAELCGEGPRKRRGPSPRRRRPTVSDRVTE